MMYKNKLYCLHEANLPMECRMHPDGRLEYVGYETFHGRLDYPVSAHPVLDGDDLLFHSYSVDEEVRLGLSNVLTDLYYWSILICHLFLLLHTNHSSSRSTVQ